MLIDRAEPYPIGLNLISPPRKKRAKPKEKMKLTQKHAAKFSAITLNLDKVNIAKKGLKILPMR